MSRLHPELHETSVLALMQSRIGKYDPKLVGLFEDMLWRDMEARVNNREAFVVKGLLCADNANTLFPMFKDDIEVRKEDDGKYTVKYNPEC